MFHCFLLLACSLKSFHKIHILIQSTFKDLLDEAREKSCMFSTSVKPFDLSEATKLSLVLSASQHINQQQLKDSFMKNFNRYSTSDFDDNDSRFSFSSSSSPVHVHSTFLLSCEFELKHHLFLEWKQRLRPDRHYL